MAEDQILVAFHPRFREVAPNFTLSVGDLLIGQTEVPGEVAVHFGHDLIGPLWQVEPSPAGKPQQSVSQRHRDENAGIQDNFEVRSHPTLSLVIATLWHHVAVVQTSFKCLPGETVESSLTFFVALVGEFKDVSQIDATLIPNPVVGHCAGLEQLDKERPGHAEQVRRTLCGDNLIIR
jgi:hypothetical protein